MSHDEQRRPFARRDFLVGCAAGATAAQAGRLAVAGMGETFPPTVHTTYAECGEDLILFTLLKAMNVTQPTYLDVGAFLPVRYSVTYFAYLMGGRGVLVEPNVDLIPALRRERPRDVVLNVGIGPDGPDSADYYCMSVPGWNSFDREHAEAAAAKTEGRVKIEKVVRLPLVPIDTVLAEHFAGRAPDLLSIDVEALDLPILKSMDFERFRPRLICSETLKHLTMEMDPAMTEFLRTRDYEPRAMTFANTIYIDRRLAK